MCHVLGEEERREHNGIGLAYIIIIIINLFCYLQGREASEREEGRASRGGMFPASSFQTSRLVAPSSPCYLRSLMSGIWGESSSWGKDDHGVY